MVKFRWETEFKKTEIGEIPKDWGVRSLGKVVEIKQGKNFSTLRLKQSGYPVFGANGLIGYADSYHYEEPQVLIACRGSTCGVINWSLPKSFVNNNAMALIPRKGTIDKRFLFFLMNLNYISGSIDETITGTGQPQITKETLTPFNIMYPPFPEQSRIATVLSWFDDLIENKKRQNKILEKTAMAIFKSWFVDFEPFKDEEFIYNEELDREIPKGWEVKAIKDLFNLVKGKKCKIVDIPRNETLPYLLIGSFKTEKVFWTLDNNVDNQYIISEKDIVFVADGESSGKILRYKYGILGSTLLYLQTKSSCDDSLDVRNFTYLFLKFYEEDIMSHRTGSAIPHLDKLYLRNFNILLPPLPILHRFHELVEPLFKKIITNQKEIMVLKKARDALLPKLVFGKLRLEEV